MKALILAAGYGTRLASVIKDTPKPLIMIGKKPLLNYLLDKIQTLPNLTEVIIVTNNKFYTHFTKWAKTNEDFPAPFKVINDGTNTPEDRLGSIGDMNFVLKTYPFKEDLFVLGGDNLFDCDLEDFSDFANKKSPMMTIGLYDIGNIEQAKNFGVVTIDRKGKITAFEEKPSSPKSSLVAMCLYYFPETTLTYLKEYLKQSDKTDKAGDYIRWLSIKKGVYGFRFQGKWYDIGSVESYEEARKKFAS